MKALIAIIIIIAIGAFIIWIRYLLDRTKVFVSYSDTLNLKNGDKVILPNKQEGIIIESLVDLLLVETKKGELYSVCRWECTPVKDKSKNNQE